MTRLALVAFALAGAAAPAAAEQPLVIDPKASELVVLLFKGGIAATLAHDHVIEATQVRGAARFDPDAPEKCALDVTVQTAGLIADRPALREKYGLKGKLSPGDIRTITRNFRAKDQLWVAKYPTITFRSTKVRYVRDGVLRGETWKIYTIEGRLTIRGKTRIVSVRARARQTGEGAARVFRAIGAVKFDQSDFGYRPYSAALGAIRVKDEVELRVSVVARPPKPKPPETED